MGWELGSGFGLVLGSGLGRAERGGAGGFVGGWGGVVGAGLRTERSEAELGGYWRGVGVVGR